MAAFGLGRARRAGAEMERLYGRDDALTLAAALLEHPARAERRSRGGTPVLIFTGPGGSGKTVLLDGLESRLDQCVPYVRIDCASAPNASVPDLLTALAFGLNRRRGPSGRLIFPRLLVGRLVMRHPRLADGIPAGGDGDAARAAIKQLLKDHRGPGKMRLFAEDLAKSVLPSVGKAVPGIDVIAKVLPGLLFDLPSAVRLWRLDRYGTLDELVELNIRFHGYGAEENKKWVDRWLFEAFFAGLRRSYRRRFSPRRVFDCAILMDNADSGESRRFLIDFANAVQIAARASGHPPVGVIATNRKGVPEAGSRPLADANRAYADRRAGLRWFPVALPDLTAEEFADMVRDLERFEERIPAMIHQLTQGQPLATRCLLEAVPREPKYPLDIGSLLADRDHRSQNGVPVGERIFDGLLTGVSPHQRDLLVTISAARDQNEVNLLRTRPLTRADAAAVLTLDVWRDAGDGKAPILPPVLHRLLARRLAERSATETADWETMHRRLRPNGAWDTLDEDDRIRELYHALALGELRPVTRRLSDWLVEMDGGQWLRRLKAVTAAPRRSPAGDDPAGDVDRLAEAIGRAETSPDKPDQHDIAKLVAGLWIAADPFTCEARQDLHLGIANQYRTAAAFCHGQDSTLLHEAIHHDGEAAKWATR